MFNSSGMLRNKKKGSISAVSVLITNNPITKAVRCEMERPFHFNIELQH